jgi:hypothetical protein
MAGLRWWSGSDKKDHSVKSEPLILSEDLLDWAARDHFNP